MTAEEIKKKLTGRGFTLEFAGDIADILTAPEKKPEPVEYYSIEEMAARWGEDVWCDFLDYDEEWKYKKLKVNLSFLKELEGGCIKVRKFKFNKTPPKIKSKQRAIDKQK